MRRNSFIVAVILMISATYAVNAQQDTQSSFYFFNPLQVNPANAGIRGTHHGILGNRIQWLGWSGAPQSQYLSLDAPVLQERIGLGTTWVNDLTGNRSFLSGNLQAAYHMPTGFKDIHLSFGLTGGFQSNRADFRGLLAEDENDPTYLQAYRESSWNFGSGLLATRNNAYLGVSLPRMLKRTMGTGMLRRHTYLMAGYLHPVSTSVVLEPSAMMKLTSGAPVSIDLSVRARFFDAIGVGILHRMRESVGLFAAYRLGAVDIGYAFDFPVNGSLAGNFGHHEVALILDLRGRKTAYSNPRLF